VAHTRPSGRQHRIAHRGQEAVITEVGGDLRHYTVDGHDVIDGYAEDEMRMVGRGMPLLPWPNRIEDGSYEFMGQTYQTALTEPARHNALHGLTQWMPWHGTDQQPDAVTMTLLLHPQEGYPFALSLAIQYQLSDGGLTVRTTATNIGDRPAPYGTGQHPYFTVGTDLIDQAWLRLPALLRMEANDRLIPTGRLIPVKGTAFDFVEGRLIGAISMDTAFASVVPDADGITRVVMQAPNGGRRITLWMEKPYEYLMVYTGDTIPDKQRRRKGIAIEPMTCAPNAFRTGLGLITLEQSKSMTTSWGVLATG
jgi:aldose 1-epimerase